ncbi:YibE/F family protein [Halonatronum saccharophilum]|uniref:YibE/F family protein n=1 Tax=Halonatronum saccharophilum TaxID=150060 RepID=UPI0004B125C7|nr:YibE/F family protein [Halonatronum saccharophilum]
MLSRRGKFIFIFLAILLLTSNTAVFAINNDVVDEMDSGSIQQEIYGRSDEYYRGRVVSVESKESELDFIELEQRAEIVIRSGPYRGETVIVDNLYAKNNMYIDVLLEEGMDVILMATVEDGRLGQVNIYDVSRERGVLYLTILFLALMLLIGGIKGLKTIITLVFTGFVIMRVLLPLLLAGYSPVIVATLSAIIIIIPTLLVIGGFNAKSFASIVGTACGVLVAGMLALWVGNISHLTGFSSEEAQMLSFMDQTIDVRGLLFAGIIIGSLGAVTDVAMSIASAISEVKNSSPYTKSKDLIICGMNVGRDIMGTMANTLLLAYVGSAIPLMLLLIGNQADFIRIINLDLIVTEFVRGVTGSIGLIIAIPITAIVAGVLIGQKE